MCYSKIKTSLASQISGIWRRVNSQPNFHIYCFDHRKERPIFDRYILFLLCANNRTMIKTDIAPYLIEFSILGKGDGSRCVNSLQFSVRNVMMRTHRIVCESHNRGDKGRLPERSDL